MAVERLHSDKLDESQILEIIALFEDSNETLGDDRNTIRVVTYHDQKIVVKSFKRPNFFNKLIYRFFRKSKARRSYENAIKLVDKGIGTPAPLAYLERINSLSFAESYYLSEYVPYDFTFREIIQDQNENNREILIEFTQFVHNMHEANIYFLDHSPGNTLIQKNASGYDFYLVDLNRMRFYKIPTGDRIKNFERLAPVKWVYQVMGKEYARLMNMEGDVVVEEMWMHASQFQSRYRRKRKIKDGYKTLLGKG